MFIGKEVEPLQPIMWVQWDESGEYERRYESENKRLYSSYLQCHRPCDAI